MDKRRMAEKLALRCDLTVAKARQVIDAIFDTRPGSGIIAVELDAGHKVRLRGFGTFSTRRLAQRNGRNPATGDPIAIPARNYPTFIPGKSLKQRVVR